MIIRPLLDHCLHTSLKKNTDLYLRSRILVGIILLYAGFCYGNAAVILLTMPLDTHMVMLGAGCPFLLGLLFTITLIRFKRSGRFHFYANLTLLWLFLIVFISIFITGGPLYSAPTLLVVLIPVMACCLLGTLGASLWFSLCGITLIS